MKNSKLFMSIFFIVGGCACEMNNTDYETALEVPNKVVASDQCVRFVDKNVEVSGDGRSWETAFSTVEEAISAAEQAVIESGQRCEVWVSENVDVPDEFCSKEDAKRSAEGSVELHDGVDVKFMSRHGSNPTEEGIPLSSPDDLSDDNRQTRDGITADAFVLTSQSWEISSAFRPYTTGGRDAAWIYAGNGSAPSAGHSLGVNTAYPHASLHVKNTASTIDQSTNVLVEPAVSNGNSRVEFCDTSTFTNKPCGYSMAFEYQGSANKLAVKSRLNSRLIADEQTNLVITRNNGYVGIGTENPDEKLVVNGTIKSKEIVVTAEIADYVFEDDFKLMSLPDVEKYIEANKHLPGIPSEKEVMRKGGTVPLGQSYTQLLQKIEELTLHLIDQNKQNERQSRTIDQLKRQVKALSGHTEKM